MNDDKELKRDIFPELMESVRAMSHARRSRSNLPVESSAIEPEEVMCDNSPVFSEKALPMIEQENAKS